MPSNSIVIQLAYLPVRADHQLPTRSTVLALKMIRAIKSTREGDVEDHHDQAVWWRKISRGTLTPLRARLSTNAGM